MNYTDITLAGPRLNNSYLPYDVDPWENKALIVAPAWDISEEEVEMVAFLAAATAGVGIMVLVSSSAVLAGREQRFPESDPWPVDDAGRLHLVAERVVSNYSHCYTARVSGLFGDVNGGPPWRYKNGENVYVPNRVTSDVSEDALLRGIRMGVSQGKRVFHVASREQYWKRAMGSVLSQGSIFSYQVERKRDVNGREYNRYIDLSVSPAKALVSSLPTLHGSILAGFEMFKLSKQIEDYVG